jgi:hypothetical protein
LLPVGRDVRLAQAEFVAVVQGRGAAQGEQEHRGQAAAGLALAAGEARLVVVAEDVVGPGAFGQGGFEFAHEAAASRSAWSREKLNGMCSSSNIASRTARLRQLRSGCSLRNAWR